MRDTTHYVASLRRELEVLLRAKEHFNRRLTEIQEACKHPEVVETAWRPGGFQAKRVCRNCGLQEYGGYGSATTDYSGRWRKTSGESGDWYGHGLKPADTKLGTEFAMPDRTRDAYKFVCSKEAT